MSAVITRVQDGNVVLAVTRDFTFDLNQHFRAAYKAHPPATPFVVDLTQAGYMDSAGLGMLLQLREFAGGSQSRVTIRGCNEVLREILKIANFERLFQIQA
jgi:anti-anti-sigma factor